MGRSTPILAVLLLASLLANAMLAVRLSRAPEPTPATPKTAAAEKRTAEAGEAAALRESLDGERKKVEELKAKVERLETDKKVLAQETPAPGKSDKLAAYKRLANWGRKLWMKYGALQYFECVGDDLKVYEGCGLGFPKGARLKPGETVAFAFIIYKSKAHRDAVNKKVMADPSAKEMPASVPFDVKRMMFGGFRGIVEG